MKTLFEYRDYRRFLREYFEEKKTENRYMLWFLGYHFNMEPDFLRGLIAGKYHLPKENITRVCAFFRFNRKETRYFKLLYRYNTAEMYSDITRLFRKLASNRSDSLSIIDRLKYTWSQRRYYPKVHASTSASWENLLAGKCNSRAFRF